MKFKLLVALVGVSALLAVSCIGNDQAKIALESQEPIEIPSLIESETKEFSCKSCVRGVVRRVIKSPVIDRVIGDRKIQRQPVRRLLRRLIRR